MICNFVWREALDCVAIISFMKCQDSLHIIYLINASQTLVNHMHTFSNVNYFLKSMILRKIKFRPLTFNRTTVCILKILLFSLCIGCRLLNIFKCVFHWQSIINVLITFPSVSSLTVQLFFNFFFSVCFNFIESLWCRHIFVLSLRIWCNYYDGCILPLCS